MRTACALAIIFFIIGVHASPANDVFWIARYGAITWQEERAHLDNIAIQLSKNHEYSAYIYINAGRVACRGEAARRAVRAKNYLVKVRRVAADRVVWKDLGYGEELKIVIYLFDRSKPIPYDPEFQSPNKEQVIKTCKTIK